MLCVNILFDQVSCVSNNSSTCFLCPSVVGDHTDIQIYRQEGQILEPSLPSSSFTYLYINNDKNDFFSGEPNNSGNNEDCLDLPSKYSWKWNDVGCSLNRPFICELHGKNMQCMLCTYHIEYWSKEFELAFDVYIWISGSHIMFEIVWGWLKHQKKIFNPGMPTQRWLVL